MGEPAEESRASAAEAAEVAKAILSQIPVMTRMELGVVKRIAITDKMGGIELHLGGAAMTRGKVVKIVLDWSDTYEVEVSRKCRRKPTAPTSVPLVTREVIGSASGIYCDMLAGTIRELVFKGTVWEER